MKPIEHRISDVLLLIEAEMRAIQFWQQTPLPKTAYQSEMPFSCDTMTIAQWLQFVFLPQMKVIVESGQRLPAPARIHTIVEEQYKEESERVAYLLQLLRRFDELSHQFL